MSSQVCKARRCPSLWLHHYLVTRGCHVAASLVADRQCWGPITILLRSDFESASGVALTGNVRCIPDARTFRPLEPGMLGLKKYHAELCGELIAPTGKSEMIKVVSDPQSKGPAAYHVWTGKDGKFCSVIATFTGKAEADLE